MFSLARNGREDQVAQAQYASRFEDRGDPFERESFPDIHEVGHVIGTGTLWERMGLVEGVGMANPRFTGASAMREFATLIGLDIPTPIPVENWGRPGTREGHWRESVFANELMTGFST